MGAVKYVKLYDIRWDEVFQIEVPADMEVPRPIETSDAPFPELKIRPRSQDEADKQRQEEYDARRS